VHDVLRVADTGQRDRALEHLRRYERRETTYFEMSRGPAESGIQKWTLDTGRMTMTFYDKTGREMLVEQLTRRFRRRSSANLLSRGGHGDLGLAKP
jgi:uncharacterized protein YbcV (DUF1398 family)